MNKYQEALDRIGRNYYLSQESGDFEHFENLYLENKKTLQELVDKFEIDEDYEIIKHKPQLTEDEKVILRNLPKECKWIVREKDDRLWVHEEIPTRSLEPCGWERRSVNSLAVNLVAFNHIFQFITWEDEPYLIEDLLK